VSSDNNQETSQLPSYDNEISRQKCGSMALVSDNINYF